MSGILGRLNPDPNCMRNDSGPFDIIGDVHGCSEELYELLHKLGYRERTPRKIGGLETPVFRHPENRRAGFIGDWIDRGPNPVETLAFVMELVEAGGVAVPGNHDFKLLRHLRNKLKPDERPKPVNIWPEFQATLDAFDNLDSNVRETFIKEVYRFLRSLPFHLVLDNGKLVLVHAGLHAKDHGQSSGRIRSMALYGETTGDLDAGGHPVRLDWTKKYKGKSLVIYGHTPSPEVYRNGKTARIDTGCAFGGSLTAFRYPEGDCVSVKAKREYAPPPKCFLNVTA